MTNGKHPHPPKSATRKKASTKATSGMKKPTAAAKLLTKKVKPAE